MPNDGQHEDVHLGVAEDPEQVLPQQRVGAVCDGEERGAELALEHQQEQRHRDHRDGEQQQELRSTRTIQVKTGMRISVMPWCAC